jgi:hypothetical protein
VTEALVGEAIPERTINGAITRRGLGCQAASLRSSIAAAMSVSSAQPSGDRQENLTEGWLPRNFRVSGKGALLSILRTWLLNSDSPTIGDTRRYHGAFWGTADIGGHRVRIAADTTREAVERVVGEIAAHPERPWRVLRNRRGRITKVQATEREVSGWYAYIHPALPGEVEL